MNQEKWDKRFLGLAYHVAEWSKDPSTQVGAVITEGNRIVSLGFNGFAAGVDDNETRLEDRSTKLKLTLHAEENALLFANQDLRGCTIYITHPPCASCMSKIAQARIARVVSPKPTPAFEDRWSEDIALAIEVCAEAGMNWTVYEDRKTDCEVLGRQG